MKKNGKRYTVLLGTLLTALAICACGGDIGRGTGNGDTESGAEETTSASRGMGKLLEDADFEADVTSWQAADGGQLLVNLPEGSYTYRTWYGRVGTGSLEHDDEDLVLIYGDLDGENDYYLLEDAGGLMPYHVNGESGGEWGELNERHFDPAAEKLAVFDRSVLDGEWQNARGYSYVFDTTAMKVAESDPIGVMSSGDMYDKEDGRGLFLGGAEILYPCLSADGNSFVLFPDGGAARDTDARSTGVFYRNGAMAQYADPANAGFREADGRLWYSDGVHEFAVPAGYTLADDGMAYDEAGQAFAPDWPETPYDPAAVWGTDWPGDGRGDLIPEDQATDGTKDPAADETDAGLKVSAADGADAGPGNRNLAALATEGSEDGRGDLIPEDQAADNATIPVLMGGALPFTGMETVREDNYADGTYCYADITADGLTMLVNTVLAKDVDTETDDLEQYLVDCARKLDETDIYELRSIMQDTTLTEKFSYPVYIVEFTTGANEDTVKWTVFAMDTDQYTYLYGVCTDMDAAEDMDGLAQDIFGGLYLSDEAA